MTRMTKAWKFSNMLWPLTTSRTHSPRLVVRRMSLWNFPWVVLRPVQANHDLYDESYREKLQTFLAEHILLLESSLRKLWGVTASFPENWNLSSRSLPRRRQIVVVSLLTIEIQRHKFLSSHLRRWNKRPSPLSMSEAWSVLFFFWGGTTGSEVGSSTTVAGSNLNLLLNLLRGNRNPLSSQFKWALRKTYIDRHILAHINKQTTELHVYGNLKAHQVLPWFLAFQLFELEIDFHVRSSDLDTSKMPWTHSLMGTLFDGDQVGAE